MTVNLNIATTNAVWFRSFLPIAGDAFGNTYVNELYFVPSPPPGTWACHVTLFWAQFGVDPYATYDLTVAYLDTSV